MGLPEIIGILLSGITAVSVLVWGFWRKGTPPAPPRRHGPPPFPEFTAEEAVSWLDDLLPKYEDDPGFQAFVKHLREHIIETGDAERATRLYRDLYTLPSPLILGVPEHLYRR